MQARTNDAHGKRATWEVAVGRGQLLKDWRRGPGSNRRIKVLQTSPLPLGYRALGRVFGLAPVRFDFPRRWPPGWCGMERETRFELATLALARRCSTTELLPLGAILSISGGPREVKPPKLPDNTRHVYGFYAVFRRVPFSSRTIWPSRMKRMRPAIAAASGLWVIIRVVWPSR